MGLVDHLGAKKVTHPGERNLSASALGVVRRPIGRQGGFGWSTSKIDDDTSQTPITAAALAHYAALALGRKQSGAMTAIGYGGSA